VKGLAGFVRWYFYPVALAITLLYIVSDVLGALGPLGKAYPIYLGALIVVMVSLELLIPLRKDWSMTWKSLLGRDLPMLAVNGVAIVATTYLITALAIGQPLYSVALGHWMPWWAEAIAAILISDFMWYWVHRICHEARGRWGRWLWKTHVLHHLPDRVYVFMHAVGHPINSAYVRIILMIPALALGFSPEAVFAAAVLNGFQGLVSHFNVDIRAGWLNRFFMGTELHRYHHSSAVSEAKNFAAVVTLWDQLFGTFEHQPDRQPAHLGISDRDHYPTDQQWGRLMAIPFVKSDPTTGRTSGT
jgi:sterol desaturase/sphingolipid hydroxylase (fatty acid hydroxylase superfamily)